MTTQPTLGVHHIGLTVPDLDQARAFFCEVLGFGEVGGVPEYPAIFVSNGAVFLTLWRAADPLTARAFDRRANIGLHHLSLSVADDAALDALWAKLSVHPEIVIDAAPGPIVPGAATRHFLVFIPGGIRMEFATPFA
ncbi:VOC family protein [Sphingomonas sp. PAMC 26605]|uniref:VOC family protein n=1 Tax=Sphingomonas sp. PAMC 26605 TaxID=1112214 RepID=UPI00026CB581|nr:VOC family protein [Sphingomonas sp. PAMC 26605]